MFYSVAINVVIGLLFIYLLYSLLATVLSETVATILNLRARNLKEAIGRMLSDEEDNRTFFQRLWDSLLLMKTSKSEIVKDFYNHPEIKYLGSSGVFKSPSNFKANSFSKALISLLVEKKPVNKENIEAKLGKINSTRKSETNVEGKNKIFDPQTEEYIQNLWQESQGDIAKFRLQLEDWFDRTMEHTIEWYKRKIRVVTFIIGFCIAWFFNADTFVIVKNLSVDKDAREKMVNMATSYVQNNKITVDTLKIKNVIELKDYEEKLDSLLAIREQLVVDINNANSILGLGCWPPDSVTVTTSAKTKQKIYSPPIDTKSIPCKIFTSDSLRQKKIYTFKSKSIESMPVEVSTKNINNGTIAFNLGAKLCYFFRLFLFHFFGFFVTAIAISLGAPFWFDLLNKLMQLRTSTKEETETVKKTSTKQAVSPLDRVG